MRANDGAKSGDVNSERRGRRHRPPADGPPRRQHAYRFEVTSGVSDLSGAAFLPLQQPRSSTGTSGRQAEVVVRRVVREGRRSAAALPAGIVYEPDNRARRQALRGHDRRRDQALRDQCRRNARPGAEHRHDPDAPTAASGCSSAWPSTRRRPRSNLILWVAHNAFAFNNATEWTGKITRLSGANLEPRPRTTSSACRGRRRTISRTAWRGARTGRCTSPRAATARWARRTSLGTASGAATQRRGPAPRCERDLVTAS